MPKALLIDDEVLVREDLRRLLAAHPGVSIVGEAGSVGSARKRLASSDYDLVFLDIQLIGGTGFDLVPHVSPAARIIFVTAYDQHALRAFEVNALDYLLKPVAPERLASALSRLGRSSVKGDDHAPPGPLSLDDNLLVKLDAGHERFIRLGDICCVFSNENYTDIQLVEGERLLVRRTMKAWEDILPAASFSRVHRHTIVNIGRVRSISRSSDSISLLRVDGVNTPVSASYRYLADLREKLAALHVR